MYFFTHSYYFDESLWADHLSVCAHPGPTDPALSAAVQNTDIQWNLGPTQECTRNRHMRHKYHFTLSVFFFYDGRKPEL